MKTGDELLNDASEYIDNAEHNEISVHENAAMVSAQALLAIACVMLAKERRESEQAPTYEQIDRLVDVMLNVQWAIQSK